MRRSQSHPELRRGWLGTHARGVGNGVKAAISNVLGKGELARDVSSPWFAVLRP